ncbi:hypothetical protein PF003_g22517 [Phytophthora fragariae]|nr:hypothetical protein PF003_g22517 [Phytophthora fragariae]
MGRKQRGYPVKVKLAAIGLVKIVGLPTAVEHLGYPHERFRKCLNPNPVQLSPATPRVSEGSTARRPASCLREESLGASQYTRSTKSKNKTSCWLRGPAVQYGTRSSLPIAATHNRDRHELY